MAEALWLVLPALAAGVGYLLLPWQPWRPGPWLQPLRDGSAAAFPDLTVLIPARNEAAGIAVTLRALLRQGTGFEVIVVDDGSQDGTAAAAAAVGDSRLRVLAGRPLPEGWLGKPWALEQGLERVRTGWVLLLDADIELAPGQLAALWDKARREQRAFASLLATPALEGFWARLLMPAFVYFFMALYPFRLANDPRSRVAAAAGGCVLARSAALRDVGGFAAIRDAVIDDCTLARRVKRAGHAIWIGLAPGVRSRRPAPDLGTIWRMVARTAYVQLRCSPAWLLACTLVMLAVYVLPLLALALMALAVLPPAGASLAALALAAVTMGYIPTLRFYGMSPLWSLFLPLVAILYMAMTWDAARRHWVGVGPEWKGRRYGRLPTGADP